MEQKNRNTAWNEQYVKAEVARALQAIDTEVKREKQQQNFSCELYHTLQNPFNANSPEHAYMEHLLTQGNERNPDYIDLFSQLHGHLKSALSSTYPHIFFMINCRFNAQCADNFLLYILISWED